MTFCIKNDAFSAQISSFGAELCSLRGKNGNEYIWQGDSKYWLGHSPLLFPIVGRLENNVYRCGKEEYHMSIHGFAKQREHKVMKQSGKEVILCFDSDHDTKEQYPFDFRLISRFVFESHGLSVTRIVENAGKTAMPFSIGEHIGFCVPINGSAAFEDHIVIMEKPETLSMQNAKNASVLLPPIPFLNNEKVIEMKQELFINGAVILRELSSRSITLCRKDGHGARIRVSFPHYSTLALWTKPGAPYLCIEPWDGHPSSPGWDGNIYTKDGIHCLNPGEHVEYPCSITIMEGELFI